MFHFSIKTFSSELKSTTKKTKLGHHNEVEADENTILYEIEPFQDLLISHLLPISLSLSPPPTPTPTPVKFTYSREKKLNTLSKKKKELNYIYHGT